MGNKKGNIPWNKGKICPEISAGLIGKPHPHKKWKMSEEGKQNIREAALKRDNTKWLEAGWKITHNSTFIPNYKGGADISARRLMERRRKYGIIAINNRFKNSNFHHITKEYGVYIPKELHQLFWHSLNRNIRIEEINLVAMDWFCNQLKG